jgi:hypothetical protein
MAGLSGTQALLLVLIILVFFFIFRRPGRRSRPDYPWRPRPGWWPEERAHRRYEEYNR